MTPTLPDLFRTIKAAGDKNAAWNQLDNLYLSRLINVILNRYKVHPNERDDCRQIASTYVYQRIQDTALDILSDTDIDYRTYLCQWIRSGLCNNWVKENAEKRRPKNGLLSINIFNNHWGESYENKEHYHEQSNEPNPLDNAIHNESLDFYRDIIAKAKLTKHERNALVLTRFKGWTYEQIHARTGRTPKQTDNAVNRSSRKIREVLERKRIVCDPME